MTRIYKNTDLTILRVCWCHKGGGSIRARQHESAGERKEVCKKLSSWSLGLCLRVCGPWSGKAVGKRAWDSSKCLILSKHFWNNKKQLISFGFIFNTVLGCGTWEQLGTFALGLYKLFKQQSSPEAISKTARASEIATENQHRNVIYTCNIFSIGRFDGQNYLQTGDTARRSHKKVHSNPNIGNNSCEMVDLCLFMFISWFLSRRTHITSWYQIYSNLRYPGKKQQIAVAGAGSFPPFQPKAFSSWRGSTSSGGRTWQLDGTRLYLLISVHTIDVDVYWIYCYWSPHTINIY